MLVAAQKERDDAKAALVKLRYFAGMTLPEAAEALGAPSLAADEDDWATEFLDLVLESEVGVLDIPERKIVKKWRLQPGKMFLIDFEQGRIVDDEELKPVKKPEAHDEEEAELGQAGRAGSEQPQGRHPGADGRGRGWGHHPGADGHDRTLGDGADEIADERVVVAVVETDPVLDGHRHAQLDGLERRRPARQAGPDRDRRREHRRRALPARSHGRVGARCVVSRRLALQGA